MPDRRIIEQRLRNLHHTKQVTEAMRVVSAVKLRRMQQEAVAGKDYVHLLLSYLATLDTHVDFESPVFETTEFCPKQPVVVVIGGDRGFAGGYYEGLRQVIRESFSPDTLEKSKWIGVGTHVERQIFKEMKLKATAYVNVSETPTKSEVLALIDIIWQGFVQAKWDSVILVSYNFISTGRQMPLLETLLPFKHQKNDVGLTVMEFEPDVETVATQLVRLALISKIWQALKESRATENVMRVQAMAGASKNAAERIQNLEREQSHIRQAQITQELIEIISGAEVR